jgi:hypothetical protein
MISNVVFHLALSAWAYSTLASSQLRNRTMRRYARNGIRHRMPGVAITARNRLLKNQ